MTQLVKYDEARKALQVASTVDEAKQIRDRAAALKVYAMQRNDVDMEHWVAEIKLRADMRIGEISRTLETAKPANGKGAGLPSGGKTKAAILKEAGISTSAAHRAEVLAENPEAVESYISEQYAAGKAVTATEALRVASKRTKRQKVTAKTHHVSREYCKTEDLETLAGQKFSTVYADPPWQYGNQGTRASTGDHYSGMSVDEICALPIELLAAENAHLHLWTTNAFLFDSKRVMEAWGFEYKSCFIWVKPQIGMGNYWRVSHEFLLLGVRGSLSFADKSLKSWLEAPRGQHSAKPERIRDLIHKASPGPRLELFARRAVEGWTCWGNEIKRELFSAELEPA